ncbi:MAG: glucosaminidase domain-containing protein [Bacteroidia bacterium]
MLKRLHIYHLFIIFFLKGLVGYAQTSTLAKQYVENFKDEAIKEMQLYNIPASITLAQGMLESGYGMSDLAKKANNHFGIKCHGDWQGPTFIQNDDEKNECFRKYSTVLDSYTDHSLFLKSRARYAHLFELNTTDYRGWAQGLKEAGYATEPQYAERLLDLIETYELYNYDLTGASGKTKKQTEKKAKQNKHEIVKKEKAVEQSKITANSHEILRLGIVKYIIVKPGDTFIQIAKETDKDLWQLYKYNDMTADDKLIVGQRIYLQPKRNKAKDEFHVVKKDETMKSISQMHGIKLKKLYKKNMMKPKEEPVVGQKLYLRKKKK